MDDTSDSDSSLDSSFASSNSPRASRYGTQHRSVRVIRKTQESRVLKGGSLEKETSWNLGLNCLIWLVFKRLCQSSVFLQKPWIQDSYQATSTMEGSRATSIVFHCSEAQWILESNHYTSIKEHSRLENSPWREMYHSSQLFFSIAM